MSLLSICSAKYVTKVIFACTILFGVGGLANAHDNHNFDVSGFIALGYANTSANNFLGEYSQNDKIINAGINVSYNLSSRLNFSGQLSYTEMGDFLSDDKPRADYAALSYISNDLGFGEQSISLGRVKTKLGLYNEYRDVPTSKPSIILPQSIYLDVFRTLFLSIDGVSVSSINKAFGGDIATQFSIGSVNIAENFRLNALGQFANGDMKRGTAYAFDIRYISSDLLLVASTYAFEPEYQAVEGDYITVNNQGPRLPIIDASIKVQNLGLSAQYYMGDFEFSAEYMYRSFDIKGLAPVGFPLKRRRPMEGYYGQVRYTLSETLTLFTRWERFYRDANNKSGQPSALAVSLGIPNWADTATTRAIGLHWRLNGKWNVMAEIHDVNGSGYLPPHALPSAASIEEKSWQLFATQLTYRF